MKKKTELILIISCVISLFIISACGGGVVDTLEDPFFGGTEGIEMEFLDDSPPEEVSDGGEFDFQAILKIINRGEFDLLKQNNHVKVSLIGFDSTEFGLTPEEKSGLKERIPIDDLIAKKRIGNDVIDPIETLLTFPENKQFNYGGNLIGDSKTFKFRADICYKYQTNSLSEICVLANLINPDKEDVCNPKGSKDVFSSGSPLQINSFRQDIAGNSKIRFSFDIVHSGTGEVFMDDGSVNCPKTPAEKRTKENSIKATVKTGINGNLNCVGIGSGTREVTGKVRLIDGKRTITCTQNLEDRRGFNKEVNIILDFNYHEFIDAYGNKGVTVRKLEFGEGTGTDQSGGQGTSTTTTTTTTNPKGNS